MAISGLLHCFNGFWFCPLTLANLLQWFSPISWKKHIFQIQLRGRPLVCRFSVKSKRPCSILVLQRLMILIFSCYLYTFFPWDCTSTVSFVVLWRKIWLINCRHPPKPSTNSDQNASTLWSNNNPEVSLNTMRQSESGMYMYANLYVTI